DLAVPAFRGGRCRVPAHAVPCFAAGRMASLEPAALGVALIGVGRHAVDPLEFASGFDLLDRAESGPGAGRGEKDPALNGAGRFEVVEQIADGLVTFSRGVDRQAPDDPAVL